MDDHPLYTRILDALPKIPDAADAAYYGELRDAIGQHKPIHVGGESWQCRGDSEAHAMGNESAPCTTLTGFAVALGVIK